MLARVEEAMDAAGGFLLSGLSRKLRGRLLPDSQRASGSISTKALFPWLVEIYLLLTLIAHRGEWAP